MKLNNKGYLVVELVVSFAISLTVTMFLLSTTFDLKKKSDFLSVETTMLTNQAVITKEIQDDMTGKTLTAVSKGENCGDYCFDFVLKDDVGELVTKTLAINVNNRTIEYGTDERPFKKRLPTGSDFGDVYIAKEKFTNEDSTNNSMIVINISIINKELNKDYPIKAIYQYKDDPLDVNGSITVGEGVTSEDFSPET